jgi:hypothetical protein
LGAGLTWAYQVGSARLGVVDLFACEISTLCRVAAALDTVRGHVGRFKEGPQANNSQTPDEFLTRPFTSEEDYFPVFQSNSRDLEVLEARVVAYITEFYTYMKAARDVQRALAQIKPPTRELSPPERVGRWHETSRNIVYMLYLGLESARNAVCQLVEFEPELAERIVVILISELEAYCFLCGQFAKEDARRQRILLRERDYRKLVH